MIPGTGTWLVLLQYQYYSYLGKGAYCYTKFQILLDFRLILLLYRIVCNCQIPIFLFSCESQTQQAGFLE